MARLPAPRLDHHPRLPLIARFGSRMNIGDAGSEMHTREGDCNLERVIECPQRSTRTSHHTLPFSDHHCYRPASPRGARRRTSQLHSSPGPGRLLSRHRMVTTPSWDLATYQPRTENHSPPPPHGPSFLQSCHGRQAFRHMPSFPDALWTTSAMVADVAKQSPNGDISSWSLYPSRMFGDWTNRSDSRLQIELA